MANPSFDSNMAGDGSFFKDALREQSGMFEERILIKRWISTAGGDEAGGTRPSDTFKNIRARATISEMSAREVGVADLFRIGDLKCEVRVEIFAGESYSGDQQAEGRKADVIVYRNRNYQIIGHVNRLHLRNKTHYKCILRQIG